MFDSLKRFGNLVAFSHSVFALPFALSAFLLALRKGALVSAPSPWMTVLGIVLAAVSARTAAMGFNRLCDREIDGRNPRTQSRELPKGEISKQLVICMVIVSSLVFVYVSGFLGWHCAVVSPFVLVVILGYSVTKRFTWLSHFALGLALALAPGGAWWVLRPQLEWEPLVLMCGVMFWVAGFDILYSLQDIQFDRTEGLRSIPARFGIDRALWISSACHAVALFSFTVLGASDLLAPGYLIGVLLLGLLLWYQHLLVQPWDFSRVGRAFFTVNGLISVGYCVVVGLSSP